MSQTYFAGRPIVNETMPDERQHRREMARAINNNTNGHNNTSLAVTLDPSVATTTITDARISLQTAVLLMPTTANAAIAKQTLYVTCAKGVATIHHASSAQADRTFTAVLIG